MANCDNVRREFSNHRQWREFIAALHESVTYPCSVTYPMVLRALQSGRDWFSDGAVRATRAVRATSWLSPRSGIQGQSFGV